MKYFFLFILLYINIPLIAQTYWVRGTITDNKNQEPLIGVTIHIKGTTEGKICDVDGNYSIKVKDGDILTFSYLEYETQEIKVHGQTKIDVQLSNNRSKWPPDDAVTTYTPAAKRGHMASAVKQVKIVHRRSGHTNSLEILNGSATGLYVAKQSNNMFNSVSGIRSGIGNIGGETTYVVDGIAGAPFNLADILSLEIVKGAPSVPGYTNATAQGGVLYFQTDNRPVDYVGRRFEANAWMGVKNAIALMPNNHKKNYNQELHSAFVQHYDIKFHDRRLFSQKRPLNISGFVSYDKIENTIKGTDGQHFSSRLTFDYRFFKWLSLNQMIYYDHQEQDNRWLYNPEITTSLNTTDLIDLKRLWNKSNIRDELFSASTFFIKPWKWMNVKSTFTYDWVNTRGSRAEQNYYYSTYRDYFDFRNQENSRTHHWMWDNSISVSHSFDYERDVFLKAGFTREMTELKTKIPAILSITPHKEWNRNIIINNMLLQGGYNYFIGVRTLSASIRRLSSILDRDNKDIYLPTIAAGWRFTSEMFFPRSDFFSTGRLKAGWGKAARSSLYMPTVPANRYGYPDFTYSGLKWQITKQTDVGAEFSFFNDKLNVSIDYYYKTTNNILENNPVNPEVLHLSSGQAKIINRGWEFSASFSNWHTSRRRWSVSGHMTINSSSIKNRLENAQLILGDYIAPKYNYGIEGTILIERLFISTRFNGVNSLYLQRTAFANPFKEDYAKINYFTLGSLNISYDQPIRFIGSNSHINIYTNIENPFYIANSSLKNEQHTDYVRFPINRMVSIGFKQFL